MEANQQIRGTGSPSLVGEKHRWTDGEAQQIGTEEKNERKTRMKAEEPDTNPGRKPFQKTAVSSSKDKGRVTSSWAEMGKQRKILPTVQRPLTVRNKGGRWLKAPWQQKGIGPQPGRNLRKFADWEEGAWTDGILKIQGLRRVLGSRSRSGDPYTSARPKKKCCNAVFKEIRRERELGGGGWERRKMKWDKKLFF